MMLRANPSRVNGYWNDTFAGSSFSSKIFRSTVILTLPEIKEKSSMIVWYLSFRETYQVQRFLLPLTCLPTSSTSNLIACICSMQFKIYQNSILHFMKFSHILIAFIILATLTSSLPEPVYTIHYLRTYRNDLIQQNFGCGKSIVYGTYIFPIGPIDALYTLMNSHTYGFNSGCQRKSTYVKLFGDAQNYEKLFSSAGNVVDQIVNLINRAGTRNIIMDWKYMPEGSLREKGREVLEQLINNFKNRGFNVTLKAPASFFCLNVGNKKYILDQPASQFIMELYGEEPGKYTTYESIFGPGSATQDLGYSAQCSKYPTKVMLDKIETKRKIYFEKTLDSTKSGFIGPNWELFLEKAGQNQYNNLFFYDGFPFQAVDF